MRRSIFFICFQLGSALILFFLLQQGPAAWQTSQLEGERQLVLRLGLTDLSIWSEARYTRHPSQADSFTAFQDYPGAFDHFPAGSIVPPGRTFQSTSLRVQKKGPL